MGLETPLGVLDEETFFIAGQYKLQAKEYQRRKHSKYIAVHCSDTPADLDIGVDTIRQWHTDPLSKQGRGWKDVGYHFVIKRDGTIERGRPVWSVGAGVMGYNDESIHVCLVGGKGKPGASSREERRTPYDNFTAKQKRSLAFMVANLLKHVAPGALVQGHRDFPDVHKACPSFDARAWWNAVKTEALEMYTQEKMP